MSRFIPDYEDHKFLIDVFQKESISEGVKIGDALRDNIHDAIELLGDELIQQNPRCFYILYGNIYSIYK